MSQVQSTNSAYYTMPWLYQPAQQSGPAATSADAFFGATDQTQSSDPFAANTQPSSTPGGTPPFSLDAMSALIAAQAQQSSTGTNTLSPQQQKVFNELDANGDGTITQSELETDFGTNNKQLADAVFSKLDTNGDGSISQDEFAAGTTKTAHHGHHHHMHANASDPSQTDPAQSSDPLDALLNATPGQNTQSVSNSDGSTTTTITYADGSKVSMTSAPTATSSDNNTTSSTSQSKPTQNLLEQLIQLQSQLTAASISAATTLSI